MLTQARIRFTVEFGNGYGGTPVFVEVPQQVLVDALNEPTVRDALERAAIAERAVARWESAYQKLKARNLWKRVLNRG